MSLFNLFRPAASRTLNRKCILAYCNSAGQVIMDYNEQTYMSSVLQAISMIFRDNCFGIAVSFADENYSRYVPLFNPESKMCRDWYQWVANSIDVSSILSLNLALGPDRSAYAQEINTIGLPISEVSESLEYIKVSALLRPPAGTLGDFAAIHFWEPAMQVSHSPDLQKHGFIHFQTYQSYKDDGMEVWESSGDLVQAMRQSINRSFYMCKNIRIRQGVGKTGYSLIWTSYNIEQIQNGMTEGMILSLAKVQG